MCSELEYGIHKSSQPFRNRIALAEFLASFDILAFDDNAAHALSIQCTLVTNNEREFKRIPGLLVENWVK